MIAFIKLEKNIKRNIDILKTSIKEKLPSHMVPSEYFFLNNFPLNQSGKIDKERLKKINK